MTWDKIKHELGRIKEQTTHQIVFVYLGDPEDLITATSSCGCSTPSIENNVIRVLYTSAAIPKHIIKEGRTDYTTTKSIAVKIKGEEEPARLKFTATIERTIIKK